MGARNKSQAVNEVLEAYVREKKMQKLLDMKGKLHLDDNWKTFASLFPKNNCKIFTLDLHFNKIPNINIFQS